MRAGAGAGAGARDTKKTNARPFKMEKKKVAVLVSRSNLGVCVGTTCPVDISQAEGQPSIICTAGIEWAASI